MPILVLALKSIKQYNIDDNTLDVVFGVLKENPEEETWQEDIARAPRWIRKIIIETKDKIKRNVQILKKPSCSMRNISVAHLAPTA